ncbi:MAG TPA: hypothetical protein GX506_04755 [Firmicutes bacterium]|nr:hypothetical protein [Bacillota bacterium]
MSRSVVRWEMGFPGCLISFTQRRIRDERGSAVIIVALAMMVLFSFAALVIDLGLIYLTRARLVNAADAAALAGVGALPDDPAEARTLAESFAVHNGVAPGRISVGISEDRREIAVELSQDVELSFARVFGISTVRVGARSRAEVGIVRGLWGAVPFGVKQQDLEYGVQYTLKYGAGGEGVPYHGNFGALALGGRGANNYRANIISGYQGILRVGDEVGTEPGNMAGPTRQGIQDRIGRCHHSPPCTYQHFTPGCPRVIYVPIIDSLDVHGRGTATIVGFAAFFLEGIEGQGGHADVVGRFLRLVTDAEIGGNQDFGLRSSRLVE